jgi:aminopeptidase N
MVDSLIISMSRRISLFEEQIALTNLIEKLQENLDATTKDQAMKKIDDNKMFIISAKYDDITTYVDEQVRRAEELENQLRLPKSSVPERYRIHLDATFIHMGSRGFTGEVEIDVKVTEKTDHIMFHSKTQAIMELKVMNKGDKSEITILDYHQYAPADTLTIYFMDDLEAGTEIIVEIVYWTQMPTTGTGFYQTSYVIDGETRYLGATQFESTGARLAFPCYDEPGLKAVFDLKITHSSSFKAIANMLGDEQVK